MNRQGGSVRDEDRSARIVRFWRTVEMFSPQGVPKLTDVSAEKGGVLDVGPDELAPWEKGHPLLAVRLPKDRTWQFTVYGGRYDIGAARAELVRVFGADSKPDDGRSGGDTALFAFTLDAEGRMLPDTAVLSSCAWAVGRLRSRGPDEPTWLDGFDDEEQAFSDAFTRLAPPKPQTAGHGLADHARGAVREAVTAAAQEAGAAVGTMTATAVGSVAGSVVGGIAGKAAGAFVGKVLTPPGRGAAPSATEPRLWITGRSLHEFVSELATALGVDTALSPAGVRVECRVVSVRGGDEAEPAFLNSFIAGDLAKIETADRGAALRAYLDDASAIPTGDRVDVRTAPAAVVSGVAPERTPTGRWPTASTRPLVVSQQFAVNQVMSELAPGEGVFAVNGPPGTGKTTMLRDVLAAIVVERAGRLAALRNPTDAFTTVLEKVPLAPKYTATVRAPRPELTGFEIVVATASNDAAENVTAEIPGLAAVGGAEEAALAVDYFTALASHVLGGDAWGMVAAVLGNMKNRTAFVRRFWYGDSASGETGAEPAVGMMHILREVREHPDTVPGWRGAVKAFRDAEREVRRLAAERQRVADRISEFTRLRATVPGLAAAVRDAAARCAEARDLVTMLTEALARATTAFQDADDELERHVEHKPGFWIVLATFFRAGRRWYAEYERLAGLRADTKKVRDELTDALPRRESELADALAARQRCEHTLRDVEQAMAAVRADIDAAGERWPGTVPFGEPDDESFQLSAPWADEELTAARNQVFLAALRLHKAFLLNAERTIRGNLAVVIAAMRTRLQIKEETLLAAWQALFLVVPMISTTFASLPRLFGGLGRESFGWLFIDEAGQATPQQAAGGLWRSRRAVIVGDPRQLEPIVTLPSSAQDAIRDYHQVAEEWAPDGTSVQRVADRLARHGTYLAEPDGESTVWVGAPLRVHRRCDHPIFSVANTIAYGGDLMVYGTADRDPFPGENLWLDVPSGQSRGNWVPAEGQALAAVLDELAVEGVKTEEIRVISPFRDVVRGSKDIARRTFGRAFAAKNVGTVHTVQGQEADVIILVLGSAPRNERARAWAAEKPNLLNVAVSRAKRRLYVIGDHRRWSVQPYFDVLASTIEHRPAPEAD
jgi:hypothetical protein